MSTLEHTTVQHADGGPPNPAQSALPSALTAPANQATQTTQAANQFGACDFSVVDPRSYPNASLAIAPPHPLSDTAQPGSSNQFLPFAGTALPPLALATPEPFSPREPPVRSISDKIGQQIRPADPASTPFTFGDAHQSAKIDMFTQLVRTKTEGPHPLLSSIPPAMAAAAGIPAVHTLSQLQQAQLASQLPQLPQMGGDQQLHPISVPHPLGPMPQTQLSNQTGIQLTQPLGNEKEPQTNALFIENPLKPASPVSSGAQQFIKKPTNARPQTSSPQTQSHTQSPPSSSNIASSSGSSKSLSPSTTVQSRVSLALLLEASAAAAQAEKNAKNTPQNGLNQSQNARNSAQNKSSTPSPELLDATEFDLVEPHAPVFPHTPRVTRSAHLKPIDRRIQSAYALNPGWSRYDMIVNDPVLNGECQRLVRGTQGCGRECDAKFSTLITFAKHIDKVHDANFRPFLCPHPRCPWAIIGFHERSECTRHIRTKHYKAMYACDYAGCNKVYNRSDAFRRHVRQAHVNPQSRYNRLNQQLFPENGSGLGARKIGIEVETEKTGENETEDETDDENGPGPKFKEENENLTQV